MKKTQTIIGIIMVVLAVGIYAGIVNAQTPPPISTIPDIPDTVTTMSFGFNVVVESDIPWDDGGIGFYYRIPGVTGWLYIPEFSGTTEGSVEWLAPADDTFYELSTQVTDNEGNEEEYHQAKAAFYVCTAYSQEDCPPPSVLESVVTLAEAGITEWGLANEIKNRWWWTHAGVGTAPVYFQAEWSIDGVIAVVDSIAVQADSTWSFVELPVTPNQSQTVRVRGIDTHEVVGPYSLWGELLLDGRPGQTEQPQVYPAGVTP